jgi:adenosylmethionine-8-amino-7-oxononanoate aminotransferase
VISRVQLVRVLATKEPFPREAGIARRLARLALDRGVLSPAGNSEIRLFPPLIISEDECDEIIAVFDEPLTELGRATLELEAHPGS